MFFFVTATTFRRGAAARACACVTWACVQAHQRVCGSRMRSAVLAHWCTWRAAGRRATDARLDSAAAETVIADMALRCVCAMRSWRRVRGEDDRLGLPLCCSIM